MVNSYYYYCHCCHYYTIVSIVRLCIKCGFCKEEKENKYKNNNYCAKSKKFFDNTIQCCRNVSLNAFFKKYFHNLNNSLKSSDRFFEKLFMPILFTLRVFARNLLRENHRRNSFSIFVLMSGLGLEPWLFV